MTDTFPRQYARTQRLTLGEPRNLTVSPDGRRVVFARSRSGADPVNCLWVVDATNGDERLVADPVRLLATVAADDADLPPAERARRERMREGAGGVTAYAVDDDVELAVFALAGQLFECDLLTGASAPIEVDGPVFDPRPSPDADLVAYVCDRELRVVDRQGGARLAVAEPDGSDTTSWGSAEFVAAEEMGRHRGFWWSPDGEQLAVCRVDESPVPIWHIADPSQPRATPRANRYPAAGAANATVTLHVVSLDGESRVEIGWDHDRFPYLAAVAWNPHGLTLTVQSRDQRDVAVLRADPATGGTEIAIADHDDVWVELVPGTGALIDADRVVTCADRDGARRLMIDGKPASPDDVQVRGVLSTTADRILVTGNPLADATVQHVYRWTPDGFDALTDAPGIHTAVAGGDTIVLRRAGLDRPGGHWELPGGEQLAGHPEVPLVVPNVVVRAHDGDRPAHAVLVPRDHDGGRLPVLLDPYGGPHAQRVVRSHNAFLTSQWFADQGFAVVVVDGRGTPGRGTAYERDVHHDLAIGVLDDQIAGLHAAAEEHPELDLDRVAIRGWSFGGYLAALAVLRRPDVFHAAIAGAPVTEWRLYDTHYTERYLGDPNDRPDVYDANSLLPIADRLTRPLLLVHGLADDNVVAAHTLQLSAALLAGGCPHEVLPLVGVTHMTPQEVVAENLLLHQLDFLRRALAGDPATVVDR